MSSAQIHVGKSQKKTTTRAHISKKHTTKGKHIQKVWKHTKRRKVESTCHLHKYTSENRRKNNHTCTHIQKTHTTKGKHIQKAWKHTKRPKVESTCHLHKYTAENCRKQNNHTCTHIPKTHTTKGKHIQKAWKHTVSDLFQTSLACPCFLYYQVLVLQSTTPVHVRILVYKYTVLSFIEPDKVPHSSRRNPDHKRVVPNHACPRGFSIVCVYKRI